MPPATPDPTPGGPALAVLIAEDHPLVTRGLGRLVDQDPRFRVAGTARTARQMRQLWRSLAPGLVVADIELPDGSAVDVAADLLGDDDAPHPVVVFYSGAPSSAQVNRAVGMGAGGVLSKEGDPGRLLDHLHRAVSGDFVLDEHTASLVAAMVASPADQQLTAREAEVIELVAIGLTNAAIARRLGISPNTVKTLLARVRSKLDAADRASAVNLAIRDGHIQPQ